MNDMQEILETTIFQTVKTKVTLHIILDRFKDKGIALRQEQVKDIEEHIINNTFDKFSLTLDDEQLKNTDIPKTILNKGKIHLDIGESTNIEQLFINEVEQCFSRLPKIIDDISNLLLTSLLDGMQKKLREDRKWRTQFEKSIRKEWQKPFDLFEIFLVLAYEFGSALNMENKSLAEMQNTNTFRILSRLHARCCQIGQEVYTLLKNGFADGAHARWRTLHEMAVIAHFIKENGEDIAYRYLCYDAVECYKAAKWYQEYCEYLGCIPLTKEEFQASKSNYEKMKDIFGSSFVKKNGWASDVIGKEAPTFSDIEFSVGMSHMRPYYQMASNNVHASPRGVFF